MYTQCPHCRAAFAVVARELALARGNVRCGHCGRVYSALERLADHPGPDDDDWPTHFKRELPPVIGIPATVETDDEVDDYPATAALLALGDRADQAPPVLVVEPHMRSGWQLWSAVAVASLCALLQIGYLMQEHWQGRPTIARWLNPLYAAVGVRLPPLARPDAFMLSARLVEPHPAIPQALMIRATLRHEHPVVLAYPVLELKLSDFSGVRLAERRFLPREYLPAGTDPAHGVIPRLNVAIELELKDPGDGAHAFEFSFR